MDENPYQPPRIPAEQEIPTKPRLRVDWYGLGRAIAVLIVSYVVVILITLALDWLGFSL